jgi:hypothetical protein
MEHAALFFTAFFFIDRRNLSLRFFPGSFFIITNIYHVGLFYLNIFLLYPLFFNKRKWWIIYFASRSHNSEFLLFEIIHGKNMVSTGDTG